MTYYAILRTKYFPLERKQKETLLSVARMIDSRRGASAATAPAEGRSATTKSVPEAVIGVSLRFLLNFLQESNTTISEAMTTAEVVRDIIVPRTASTKETYVNSHLLGHPEYITDLRTDYRKDKALKFWCANGCFIFTSGFFCFLSHAWAMPFHTLIDIAKQAAMLHFTQQSNMLIHIHEKDDILDNSFFWIDVFCKNQHIPAPAMEEFYKVVYLILVFCVLF